jgi:hypothetical protein
LLFVLRGKTRKHDPHRIDSRQIHTRVMVSASLSFREMKSVPGVQITRAGTT